MGVAGGLGVRVVVGDLVIVVRVPGFLTPPERVATGLLARVQVGFRTEPLVALSVVLGLRIRIGAEITFETEIS